jgi:hypothetical protein
MVPKFQVALHASNAALPILNLWELSHSLQLGPRQVATSAAYRIRNSGPQQSDGASSLYSLGSATMKTKRFNVTMKQALPYNNITEAFP